jgi:malonyl-CoA O-methyltransferase
MLETRAAYEMWAGTYPAVAHNPLMRAEQAVVEPLLTRLPARRALDVGTGSGRYLPILAASRASLVVGIDFSRAMLTSGRTSPPLRTNVGTDLRVSFERICADACRLPFRRGAFDLINASLMVGDVRDLPAWTREMARALASGGHLVYSDFHPSWTEHGWRRTFQSVDGASHDMPFEPHTIDDHLAALAAAGLHVDAIREPRLSDDGDPQVRRFKKKWGNPPVAAVFHAVKEP